MSAHLHGRGLAQAIADAERMPGGTPGVANEIARWRSRLASYSGLPRLSRPKYQPARSMCSACSAEAFVSPGYQHRHCTQNPKGVWK